MASHMLSAWGICPISPVPPCHNLAILKPAAATHDCTWPLWASEDPPEVSSLCFPRMRATPHISRFRYSRGFQNRIPTGIWAWLHKLSITQFSALLFSFQLSIFLLLFLTTSCVCKLTAGSTVVGATETVIWGCNQILLGSKKFVHCFLYSLLLSVFSDICHSKRNLSFIDMGNTYSSFSPYIRGSPSSNSGPDLLMKCSSKLSIP